MTINYVIPEPDWPQTVPAITTPSIPHNCEAEEAALGCVLINPDCYFELAEFLRAEHFYIHRHKWIWEAFGRLDARRAPLDLITLSAELEHKGQLAEIGGSAFLTALTMQVPSSLNAVSYGRIIEGHAIERVMIEAANKIASLAYNTEMPIEEKISQATGQITDISILNNGHNFITLANLLSDTYDTIEERSKDPKEVWGYATGLPTFDRETGGIQQGELIYLAGSPGCGKTWLDLSWGMQFGKQAPGAILSLEMKRGAIGRRILSGLSGVSTRAMKSGIGISDKFPLLIKAIDQDSNIPVIIDDSSYDTNRLRLALAYAKREFGIKWFILDYALLLLDGGKDETEQTKIISANMKRIVHDLDLAGVVLHSVTKIGMDADNEPRMADQRGSGQAIHDADVQLFLTSLYEKDSRLPELSVSQKSKMATLWCSKGRELEKSKFKVHLVRQGNSPFWGEYAIERPEPEYRERKDIDG